MEEEEFQKLIFMSCLFHLTNKNRGVKESGTTGP